MLPQSCPQSFSELFSDVSELCRSVAELCRAVLRGLHRVAENLVREKITLQRKLFVAAISPYRLELLGGFVVLGCLSCVELPQSWPIVFPRKERC